ncbi:MAG TPA: DUF1553 domain-containing protein [Chthoniobacter sp.]|jgi:hypothetical protein
MKPRSAQCLVLSAQCRSHLPHRRHASKIAATEVRAPRATPTRRNGSSALSTKHLALLFLFLFLFLPARAAESPLTPEGREFFESKIRPVLVAECNECHSASKHKGGLRLDYRDGWKKGGDSGDDIVPGNAAKSLLIKSIRHEDPDLKMPAKSPKLDDQVIADFEKWINMGAPDPRDQPPAEKTGKPAWPDLLAARRTWWSLQPVHQPAVPVVKNTAWSAHPVDRFLLAKMEEHGLAPAVDADPRTFIRRLTFTLTGLPPTPAEVEEFVAECSAHRDSQTTGQSDKEKGAAKSVSLSESPIVSLSSRLPEKAIEQAIDRLLASPHFGEHWARHWLDLVRYAETHGSEGDPEIRDAWRYRDYLIRAFNQDIPIDQLIRENLAGDLLAHPRINPDGFSESILGTAQFAFVEHGFQPVDTLDEEVKTVDNQIDVVSKAFQGLTISCARCHDHKFDAISQHDYYALFGIFASCRPAQVTIDTPEVQSKNRDALEQLHGQIKSALADAWQKAADQIPNRLREASEQAGKQTEIAAKTQDLQQRIADLDWTARRALKSTTAAPALQNLPAPFADWSFEKDASDRLGHLDGHLEGGAEIRHGRLILDGKDAYFHTDALPMTLGAKTLEVWAAPSTLDQHGGGVISVESTDVHGFDAIVFAEREPRRWYPGSNFGLRSENVGGPDETAKPGEWVHMAIVYGADNSIAVYRNGLPYGHAYIAKSEQKKFEAGKARLLLGLRHKGAANGFFAGEIKEARLYDRALTPKQVAASYHAGSGPVITPDQILAALTPEQRKARTALTAQLESLQTESAKNSSAEAWTKAFADADKNPANSLHLWARLKNTSDTDFPAAWKKLVDPLKARLNEARKETAANIKTTWNLAGADYAKWFPYGPGLSAHPISVGDFALAPGGDRLLDGLAAGGALTNRLSEKYTGILTSPRFKIETDSISVHACGAGGAMVRVIVDNYPLPSNPIFPKAILDKSTPGWIRLDTAYRKGNYAYIEFATREDLTRPLQEKDKSKAKPNRDEPSWFAVDQVVFHDNKQPPAEIDSALEPLLAGSAPTSAADLAKSYRQAIADAVTSWRNNAVTEPQRLLLDDLVRRGLLPVTLAEVPAVHPLVAEYRQLESAVPEMRHAPGFIEAQGYDAPLLPRGDHHKPGELVPRAYLEVFGGHSYRTNLSGRLELAQAITSPQNPLTARVMANRIWYWLFDRGIVATVDNFGRMGEKPTHPELLDFLAARLMEDHWSLKDAIRYLATTRAFAMSSEPSAQARETDPANDWLSHMRVHRLEAESIRDSLLADSGQLDNTMFGASVDANAPRRSVYLQVRRNALNPFLQVFDAPKPFTTLGRRDVTNVPAQSLALLNSLFVIDQSKKWAAAVVHDGSDCAATRVRRMFDTTFARQPSDQEIAAASEYLSVLIRDRKIRTDELLISAPVWQDFAQSLFNFKEFIYLR